ncbi:MAG: hypothetical protein ACRBF0_15190 [Calditrichia bacterium]
MVKKNTAILVLMLIVGICQAQTISELQSQKRYYQSELSKKQLSMMSYILQHKAATAAIIASGGGLASFLTENMDDDTRGILAVVGLFGLAYCLDNARECAATTVELTAYSTIITGYNNKIKFINQQLTSTTGTSFSPSGGSSSPLSVKGSDKKGPVFSTSYPYGIYSSYGNEIKLIFSKDYVSAASGYATPYIRSAKKIAEKASSKLHNTSNDYLYTLLEAGQQLTLKFTSTTNGTNSKLGYLVVYRTTSGKFYSFTNDKDRWEEMKIGVTTNPYWYIGGSKIMIRAVRPTYNADDKGREIDYRFIVVKK